MSEEVKTVAFGQHDQHEREFIGQQQQLIQVLKQEVVRLQDQLHASAAAELQLRQQLDAARESLAFLQEKISNITENNESLLRTVHVFQREFMSREGGALSKLPVQLNGSEGPFHIEIVRNLKSKLGNVQVEPSKFSQRSQFSDYYGFSLQDESVEESEVVLFNELVEKKKSISTSKIRALGRKKYFHEKFRHVFWFNTVQNKQRINQRLYAHLQHTLESASQNCRPKRSIIDLDLRRMDLRLDEEKSRKISGEIKRLLEMFELLRPDIKYVQGMSYLSWILLIRLNPYQAFHCFCNLILSDPFLFALYSFHEANIKTIVAFFGEVLKDKRPKLARHMTELAVDSELFLIEWAYTLYSRAFSLRIVSKIWDLWFSEGYNTFFRVAMAILEALEPQILEKDENDKVIDTIRRGTFRINEDEFLRVLGKQKLFEELKIQ